MNNNITLTFQNQEQNISLQPGDLVYYVKNLNNSFGGIMWNQTGDSEFDGQYLDEDGNDMPAGVSTMILIGQVIAITTDDNPNQIEDVPEDTESVFMVHVLCPMNGIIPPATNDFIFFTKDTIAEKASVKGYYSKVHLLNTSRKKAELYSVSCEVSESSK